MIATRSTVLPGGNVIATRSTVLPGGSVIATPSTVLPGGLRFDVGLEPAATKPPEARGLARHDVRLLVASDDGIEHMRFRALPRVLRAGDLLVINTSATLPAAMFGERIGTGAASVHFSTELDDGSWLVEVRPPVNATGPVDDAVAGERIRFGDGAVLTLRAPYSSDGVASRLWYATLSGASVRDVLRRFGRPIAYAYIEGVWPLSAYQTVFARHPGSAEMPGAARPFSHRLVSRLVADGVGFAPVLLHTGVSSLEAGEPPIPERYAVPASTAARVNATRAAGGRVIAVGTTAARALESTADAAGHVSAGAGWTDLLLGAERPARTLDGLITGWHTAGASHLELLEAVAGVERVERAYDEAQAGGYLWHEFGDSCLLLR